MSTYEESLRYIENAKANLKLAGKEYNHYQDVKYVKTACGVAYNGVLLALDEWLSQKGFKLTKRRKSIEWYRDSVAKYDKKLLVDLRSAYNILHLYGYYDGETNATVVQEGLKTAVSIIERIKP